jgi:PAS domain S-box-containing protein
MPNHSQGIETEQPVLRELGSELLLKPSEGLFLVKDVMSSNVLSVSSDTALADVAERMESHNVSCSVVLEQDKIVGILSEHDFLKAVAGDYGELYQLQVADAMSGSVETIGPEQTILQAAHLMETRRIRRLPVVDNDQLVGIITQTDLIKALLSVGAHHTVSNIMSTNIITTSIHTTVAHVSGIMDRHHVSCVIAEEAGTPVGIVSERDILRKVTGARKNPITLKVIDIMSTPIVSIAPTYSVFSAARLLDQKGLHRLVVMDEGQLCGIITQTDIFHATKQTLQDQEQTRLQRLDHSSSMVFMLDPQCCVTYCNPAFTTFLGIENPPELINRPFLPVQFWSKPWERSYFMEGLAQRVVQQEELELMTAQGETVFVNVLCIFGEETQGSQGILHDITARKTAERVLAASLEETEKANHELKTMQSQLVQNEKLASIGQLAAGVAHEMNTPVGFVASNFETLVTYVDKLTTMFNVYDDFVDRVESSGQEAFTRSIQTLHDTRQNLKLDFVLKDIQELFTESNEGLKRVTSIVQNLRDFSRIDQQQKREDYSINDCITSTLIVARNEIKYDADVKTDLGEIPLIPCHAGQINQVLLNILVNATHAIKSQENRQDKGLLCIKTYTTEDDVVCRIRDNGPGIPKGTLLKIFDPFFTTKPPGKGTGLGLSVSHDIIVSKHQGQLRVESEVGEGTTFYIHLPRTPKAASPGEHNISNE